MRDQALGRGGNEPERILLLVAAVCVYARLYYGVDFTDEAFYVGLPYSFQLGHRPLIDEIAVHQLGGLVLQPFAAAHLALVGSQSGLVLGARHLYFVCALGSALVVRGYLSRVFGKREATLAAALSLSYVGFLIPSLSYNSIASFGLFSGTVLLASALLRGRRLPRLVLGTALLALAGFVYPPILLAALTGLALALAGIWRVCEPDQRWRTLLVVALTGAACVAAGLMAVARHGGLEEVVRVMELSRALDVQGGGIGKLSNVIGEISIERSFLLALSGLLVATVLLYRSASREAVLVSLGVCLFPALLLVDLLYWPFNEPYTTSPFVLSACGLAAPLAVYALRRELERPQWLGLVCITVTSEVAALAILWSSANGLRNTALGLLPAALIAISSLPTLRRRWTGESAGLETEAAASVGSGLAHTMLVTSLVAFQILQMWTHTYGDFAIGMLSAPIEAGAWAGIRTTPGRKAFVETLEADLVEVRGDAQTVIFFDYFPGGYLMSNLKPRTPAIWLFPPSDLFFGNSASRALYALDLRQKRPLPDLVVRMRCIPMTNRITSLPLEPDEPVAQELSRGRYRPMLTRECYTISKRIRGADAS